MHLFRCVIADPPWPYTDKKAGMKKTGKGAESHYSCLSLEQIRRFPFVESFGFLYSDPLISDTIAPDAHLWLWVTNACMEPGHEVCRAWGFEPKTIVTWVKGRLDVLKYPERARLIQQIGQGSYLRNSTEHVIFAVRGTCPPRVRNLPTAFIAPRTEHSRKPDTIHEWAGQLSPGPYLELFATRERKGWTTLGDQL